MQTGRFFALADCSRILVVTVFAHSGGIVAEISANYLDELLLPYGLISRGVLDSSAATLPAMADGRPALSMMLIGSAGSTFWPRFRASPEFRDGQVDPLDRWSRRVAQGISEGLGADCIYPFDGPPYQPFSAWAKAADTVQGSALGMLIHPQYGLSHAYRFALLFPTVLKRSTGTVALESICASCADQPCLQSCPVEAFSAKGYDVATCSGYLADQADAACHDSGCAARNACPVGISFRYVPEHARFHMTAFCSAQRRRITDNPTP